MNHPLIERAMQLIAEEQVLNASASTALDTLILSERQAALLEIAARDKYLMGRGILRRPAVQTRAERKGLGS